MADPENKDKIKEILEGHSKKFSTAEIIVGIIVVLIIGVGAGYAIFKLILPPPTPLEYQTQPINEQQNIEVTQPTPKQAAASLTKTNQKENKKNKSQQAYIPPAQTNNQATDNNTQAKQNLIPASVKPPQQNKTVINTQKTPSSGPEIINPYNTTTARTQKKQPETKPAPESKYKSIKKNIIHKKHHTISKNRKTKKSPVVQKKYILQVSSNSNRKFAIATLLKLRKCGHKAFTKEIEIKGKKYTRVYVGPIKGYEAAKDEAENIKRQLHLGYLPIIKRYDKVP